MPRAWHTALAQASQPAGGLPTSSHPYHAHHSAANLSPRSDPSGRIAGRPIVWFVAERDIAVGEELHFFYGKAMEESIRSTATDIEAIWKRPG